MFAHQVIEDLQKKIPLYDSSYQTLLRKNIQLIQDAKKFHLGEVKEIVDLFERTLEHFHHDRIPFFTGEAAVNIRNPYKLCWYDFDNRNIYDRIHNKSNEEGHSLQDEIINITRKCGYIVEEVLPEVFIFSFFGETGNGWSLHSAAYCVIIDNTASQLLEKYGDELQKIENAHVLLKIFATHQGDGNIYPIPLVPQATSDYRYNELMERHLMLLNCTLMLLNTPNIGTAPNYPPKQLNKARKKRNKKPIDVYHTLILKPPAKKQREGIIEPKGLWTMKFHARKGHFAYYGPEGPLFGHYVGRVWIPAYECGDPSQGSVEKDYKVQLPKKL